MGHSRNEACRRLDWNTTNSALKDIIPLYGRLTIICMISDEIIWTASKIIRNCTDLWVRKPIQNLFLKMLHACLIWWWILLLFLGLQLDITGDMKHNLSGSKICFMLFFLEKNIVFVLVDVCNKSPLSHCKKYCFSYMLTPVNHWSIAFSWAAEITKPNFRLK